MAVIATDVLGSATATEIAATFDSSRASDATDAVISLQQLNKAFLTLAIRLADGDGMDVANFAVGLPGTTLQSLRHLSDDALNRLANCPYALFELPLNTVATPVSEDQRRCAVAVLFYAWHVAQAAPTRAQLWFCLDATSALRLRSLAALELSALADTNSGALRARLGDQSRYWPVMIRAAESGDFAQLRLTQLLGRQLVTQVMGQAIGQSSALRL